MINKSKKQWAKIAKVAKRILHDNEKLEDVILKSGSEIVMEWRKSDQAEMILCQKAIIAHAEEMAAQ